MTIPRLQGPAFELTPSRVLATEAHWSSLMQEGWDYFRVIVAPAAGPRNLMTMGLDMQIFEKLAAAALPMTASATTTEKNSQIAMSNRKQPTWLVGGSFAALRNCALVSEAVQAAKQQTPCHGMCATERLVHSFTKMVYRRGDTSETLEPMMSNLYQLAAPNPADILDTSLTHFRLAITVTAMQPSYNLLPKPLLRMLFYSMLAANMVSPKMLDVFQHRVVFYSGPEPPPFFAQEPHVTCVPLTADNIHQVLHATTCVPFVSTHCTFIEGVGPGLFFDGALADYQLGFTKGDPQYPVLVLGMAPPGSSLKANIWDTFVPWRGIPPHGMDHVSVLSPTLAFQEQLHNKAFPSTWDFFKAEYIDQPRLRIENWLRVFQISRESMPEHPVTLIQSGQTHEARAQEQEAMLENQFQDSDYYARSSQAKGMKGRPGLRRTWAQFLTETARHIVHSLLPASQRKHVITRRKSDQHRWESGVTNMLPTSPNRL